MKIGEEISKIIDLYQSGNSLCDVAKFLRRGVPTIKDVLIANNIEIRGQHSSHPTSKRNTDLSDHHKQIIEGLLLGDGSVIRQKRDRTAKLSVRTTEKLFADHIVLSFPLSINVYSYQPKTTIIRGKECRCKENYKVESKVDNSLNEFREKWYLDGVKVIPSDLELTPVSIRYWFYGDGTSSFMNSHKSVVLVFYTNSFLYSECEFLQKQLLEKTGVYFNINSDRGKPILKVSSRKAAFDFFQYIGECDVDCYKYKWKLPA